MASQSLIIRLKVPVSLDDGEAKPVDAAKFHKEMAKKEEEKAQKKDDFKFNPKIRIPALRDRQVKPMDAVKVQTEEKPKKMVAFVERKTKLLHNGETDKLEKIAPPTNVSEEERLEASIKKVKEWYRTTEACKRKIQVIDLQKSAPLCNKKARKTIY